ncbi:MULTISPECIES: peptidoglycan DD-metalloendopeptidase family protein [Anaerotruncus]|uniref:peptidoglycan DD-metalloendopeptidase family protein n=3 Tax=Oscillospiraceae TaxID=216572 RepID=UPI0008377E0D|nr:MULTISPECIES: peptidoglycan DD-metalloendopeptidase family protein [Anaerotruncus]
MEKPAVKIRKTTAGKMTESSGIFGKLLWMACMAAAVFLFYAVAPGMKAEARAQVVRETRAVTFTEKIPFRTDYIELPNYYRGYTEHVSDGVMGEKETTFQVVYEGGIPVRIVSVQSRELAKPVNEVVRRGAKVLESRTVDGGASKVSFANPLKGRGWLSADFYDYHGHNGIDIAAPRGTPVYAAAEGKVSLAGWYGEYGRCVIIDHADGSQTLYGHNSALMVSAGQTVKQGQKIAEVGSTGNSTGNHLHLELRVGSRFLDPLIYLDQ